MEWVQTTGRSVAEAKEAALDQLGVAEDDAEFEVLDEPRAGLFGRVRGEARVRARVRPTTPRAKPDRKERGRRPESGEARKPETAAASTSGTSGTSGSNGAGRRPAGSAPRSSSNLDRPRSSNPRPLESSEPVDPQAVGEQAVAFLDGLVGVFGLQGTSRLEQDGEELEVMVEGADLGILVGPRGATLLAIQDVTRVASQRRLGDHSTHLRVDVAGYRAKRREALARFTQKVVDEVKATGTARSLEPMPSSDRKVVHDTVGALSGVSSRSDGEEPNRRVVIVPSGD